MEDRLREYPPSPTTDLQGIERILRTVAIMAAVLLVGDVLREVLLLAFAAILVACVLRGASTQLSRIIPIAPRWSLLLVVLALIMVGALLAWWRGPEIADQVTALFGQLGTEAGRLWQRIDDTEWGSSLFGHLRDNLGGLGSYVTGIASSTFGIVGGLLLVGVTAIFLALAPQIYLDGAVRLLPTSARPRGRDVALETGATLQRWFVGQLVDMLAVTILVGAGLYALGVPLAFTLAVFAGLLNFIPFIGALAGAIPAILVALGQSPTLALWVAGLFLVVQMLEGNLIAPVVQKRAVALPPALTIFSQTILGTLFGPLGLILATPIMAALMTAVRMAYVETVLEGVDRKATEISAQNTPIT